MVIWYFLEFLQVNKDVVMTSGSGGVTLSIITWILVIMLLLNEFALYWEKRNMPTEHLTVDTSIDEQVRWAAGVMKDWIKSNPRQ